MKKLHLVRSFFSAFFLLINEVECQSKLNVGIKGIPTCEKPFVIVIPSYNNEKYCKLNLESLFTQNYNNWRAIYIDDASTDDTYNKVSNLIENWGFQDRIILIRNAENRKALNNIYNAVHACENYEIIVTLDGDDWLKHPHVLETLNEYYANEDTWLTYGQYERFPEGDPGCSKPVELSLLKQGKVRETPWVYSHLRTFYAGLFKRIKITDLMFEGKFFPSAYDLAIMFPMIEMAREHVFFLPEVSYIYNYANPINVAHIRPTEQGSIELYIRKLPIYPKLNTHPSNPTYEHEEKTSNF